jgi:hypothetical protein
MAHFCTYLLQTTLAQIPLHEILLLEEIPAKAHTDWRHF